MLQTFALAVQSTHAAPLNPQAVSRSRISTLQRPSPVQHPEQFFGPHGPQTRCEALHRSAPAHTAQVPEPPHALAWVPS